MPDCRRSTPICRVAPLTARWYTFASAGVLPWVSRPRRLKIWVEDPTWQEPPEPGKARGHPRTEARAPVAPPAHGEPSDRSEAKTLVQQAADIALGALTAMGRPRSPPRSAPSTRRPRRASSTRTMPRAARAGSWPRSTRPISSMIPLRATAAPKNEPRRARPRSARRSPPPRPPRPPPQAADRPAPPPARRRSP